MNDKYILVKQISVPCDDLFKWGMWMQKGARHIGDITKHGVRVSTIFLGLDHSFGHGKPVLWETMIFGGERDGDLCRYSDINKAREGHRRAVKMIRCDFKRLKRLKMERTNQITGITGINAQLIIMDEIGV